MKPRQSDPDEFEDPRSRDFLEDYVPTLAPPRPKFRRLCITADNAVWLQHFSPHTPMVVLVHSGMVQVWRDGEAFRANPGDTILLTPGRFYMQATSLDRRGLIELEYAKFPLSIVAAIAGNAGTAESIAFGAADHSGVFVQERMLKPILRNIETWSAHTKLMETVLMTLVHSLSPAVFPFLRSAYFETRWAFQAMMETCSRKPAIDEVARQYVHGRAAFFAHCELYTGLSPMKWFLRRRMELADRWLHVAHKPVWEVAAALGYRGVRKFRSEFRAHFHRHPEDPGVPLGFGRSRNLDSPQCCLRPFWWPYPLPLGQHDFCGINGPMSANRISTSFVDDGAPAIGTEIQSATPHAEELGTRTFVELIPLNPREEETKAFISHFNTLEPIPIIDLLPFTAEWPTLLKAA